MPLRAPIQRRHGAKGGGIAQTVHPGLSLPLGLLSRENVNVLIAQGVAGMDRVALQDLES